MAQTDVVFQIAESLLEIHCHSAGIAHVVQPVGDQGISADLLEHIVQRDPFFFRGGQYARGIFLNDSDVNHKSVRKQLAPPV